jgi:drug/metabolite transporter (DMT)-like permease
MPLFFGLCLILGVVLLAISYFVDYGPSDSWPQDWYQPGAGVVLLLVGIVGEACVWAW